MNLFRRIRNRKKDGPSISQERRTVLTSGSKFLVLASVGTFFIGFFTRAFRPSQAKVQMPTKPGHDPVLDAKYR